MLSQVTSIARSPSRAGSAPLSGARAPQTARSSDIVDLRRYMPRQLLTQRPAALAGVLQDRPFELVFPAGMTTLPDWVESVAPSVIRLPGYEGRTVSARGRLDRLEVGGNKVRSIQVNEGCTVSVPDRGHVDPVRVDWLSARGDIRRTGFPENHLNRATALASDSTMPRNGAVKFADPWYTHEPIVCRHFAARNDAGYSSAEEAGDMEAGTRNSRLPQVERHAAHARRLFGTPARVKAAVPHSYDSRFYELISQSKSATIVDKPDFGNWVDSQFKHMRSPSRRTYLLVTKNHAMNLVLTARPETTGQTTYSVMLKDPNRPAAPSSLETTERSDSREWSLDRLIDPAFKDKYFPNDDNGKPNSTSLLVRTPRGNQKKQFDAAQHGGVSNHALKLFPKTLPASSNDLRFGGELGAYSHQVSPQLDQLDPADVFGRLKQGGQIALRFATGNASLITDFFATVRRLCEGKQLTEKQAVQLVMPQRKAYPAHVAVIEGRPDALRRYREGLTSMIDDGLLTARYKRWFSALLDDKAIEVTTTLARTGDRLQKEAAEQYEALVATLKQEIDLGESDDAIRL